MFRTTALCATAVLALVACRREAPKSDLTPLIGVGGNVYCVADAEELSLKGKANTDPMATWILIHHYNHCEPDKNRSAQLLRMQMNRGDAVMMESLADFNRRVDLGRKQLAKSQ